MTTEKLKPGDKVRTFYEYWNKGHICTKCGKLLELAKPEPAEPEPPNVGCYDCGLAYAGPAWCDIVVPDDIWAKITPSDHPEGGLLCFNCITKRCNEQGLTGFVAKIMSGPFLTEWQRFPESTEPAEPEQPIVPEVGDVVEIVALETMRGQHSHPDIYRYAGLEGLVSSVNSDGTFYFRPTAWNGDGCYLFFNRIKRIVRRAGEVESKAESKLSPETEQWPDELAEDAGPSEEEIEIAYNWCRFPNRWANIPDFLRPMNVKFANRIYALGVAAGKRTAESENRQLREKIAEQEAEIEKLEKMNGNIEERLTKKIEEKQAEIARLKSAPLTATAGPPTKEQLDNAGDDDYWVFKSTDYLLLSFVKTLDMRNLVANRLNILWHIYLGPITPPQPQPEPMPVGWWQDSSGEVHAEYGDDCFLKSLNNNNWRKAAWNYGEVPEWVDAARKAGQ
jgi:hypothetical protein